MNENLKAFLQKASEDEELKAKLAELDASGMSDAKAKFVKLAEENGYNFKEEDIEPAAAEKEKLSEDELNTVSGGKYTVEFCGKLTTDCFCEMNGSGAADDLQKECTCIIAGCGELTALGKQKADKDEIWWEGHVSAKAAMYCTVSGI